MDPISSKAAQWIDNGKDPRSAHWQAGLEAMLELFSAHVKPGVLTPVAPLDEADFPVFKAALEAIDLAPQLIAVFLPPAIARSITPPETAQELNRINQDQPSYKVIIARPGKELRILCGEISPQATKPGVDIFQSGALLGNYDFSSQETCLAELSKIIRTHAWEKGTWTRKNNETYTLNWFERSLDLGRGDLSVDKNHSFFHSPTLIKSNRVDALFFIISTLLEQRFKDPEDRLSQRVAAIKALEDTTLSREKLADLVSSGILELLNNVKELELMKFNELSNAEREKFKNETARSVQIIVDALL
ncbi:hypothetical protein HRM2_45130 [Desulforapulum autotrophicum HRM2]|uniref:Uncharacterized protein n=1 Tax=Desulforapulum autotrophicum (strain ATCC 43914 / DSM 3382 / VKM B-1955 / HRM2) TaxID=177437 RepID=C0QF68_DESAH|nr:hypothetical protein [Desulforapulum autotrophicum]ACN17569.1 hypothetical protein HRM2_45130 [Desulforapulum autotrophicum HRM2]